MSLHPQRSSNLSAAYIAGLLAALAATSGLSGPSAHAQDRVCFPPHVGLPHHGRLPPTIDGFVDRELGIDTSAVDPVEQGWVRAPRISFSEGQSPALAEFRSIRHNSQPYLYLSFVVRLDESFDEQDTIVIVLKGGAPGAATHGTDERRIHIYPLFEIGAGDASMGLAPAATFSASGYSIRSGAPPRRTDYFKWVDAPGITPHWESMPTAPTNTEIKVRSWEMGADHTWSVEVKVPATIAAGGTNWIDISNDFGLYFNMVRTCGSAACSTTYHGTTPALDEHFAVEFAWPRANYATGQGLLQDPAGGSVPLDQIQIEPGWLGHGLKQSASGSTCRGVRFANLPTVRQGAGPDGTSIDANLANTFVARLINDGDAATGRGVRAQFRIANWGIGGGIGSWDQVTPDPGQSNPTAYQDIPADGGTHELKTQWTLSAADRARYCATSGSACPPGTLDRHQCVQVVLDSNQDAFFSEASTWNNMNITGLSSVANQASVSGKGWGKPFTPDGKHQFRITRNQRLIYHPGVTSEANGAEVRSKVAVDRVSEAATLPRISSAKPDIKREFGELPQFKDVRDAKELLQLPEQRLLQQVVARPNVRHWSWVWLVSGYRMIERTITIDGQVHRVYQPAGGFGYEGLHAGNAVKFADQLRSSAGELRRVVRPPPRPPLGGPTAPGVATRKVESTTDEVAVDDNALETNAYTLAVPDGQVVTLQTSLEVTDAAGVCQGCCGCAPTPVTAAAQFLGMLPVVAAIFGIRRRRRSSGASKTDPSPEE